MRLTLTHGYPTPYPDNLTDEEQHALSNDAPSRCLNLSGVVAFQWLHTVTVEFDNDLDFVLARELTGWQTWSDRVLEAQLSAKDGYGHPAIVAGNTAYCGFILSPEE